MTHSSLPPPPSLLTRERPLGPKVQVPRLRRQRYYLWMKGVGRLPQSATLLHAVANYHLSAQGCADLLLQIDRCVLRYWDGDGGGGVGNPPKGVRKRTLMMAAIDSDL